jgi:hypothetical protein
VHFIDLSRGCEHSATWLDSILRCILYSKGGLRRRECFNKCTVTVTLGQEGEEAVGVTGPKVAIQIPGSDQIRIPDALSSTTLTEVKNVASQSYTQQLQDFVTYSQQNRLTFELYVRPSTQLSGPLQQAVANGDVVLKYIPGAK